MPKIVHEGELSDASIRVNGRVVCAEIYDVSRRTPFFRFQTWGAEEKHTEINQLIGRRVRITIETLS